MADGSTDNKNDDGEFDFAEEFLQHELMNQTRAYIERGRRYQMLNDFDVARAWVAAFERCFDEKTAENCRDMVDAAAEIRLRGIAMPYDKVKERGLALQADLARLDPEHDCSSELELKIVEFLAQRNKPKN
jgi:hypothetical protein